MEKQITSFSILVDVLKYGKMDHISVSFSLIKFDCGKTHPISVSLLKTRDMIW